MKLDIVKALSKSEIKEIHEATLKLLEDTGMHIASEGALKILEETGAKVDFKTQRVKFGRYLTMKKQLQVSRYSKQTKKQILINVSLMVLIFWLAIGSNGFYLAVFKVMVIMKYWQWF